MLAWFSINKSRIFMHDPVEAWAFEFRDENDILHVWTCLRGTPLIVSSE